MTRQVLLAAIVLAGCTGTISGSSGGGGGGSGGDDDTSAPDAMATPVPGQQAVVRGQMWVAAMVPYCQAPNHAADADPDCAATCTRPDNADWNPYRSDCSGFVSWAWDLPSPGRTTADFAPFTTDITHEIDATELRAGDAVNNDEHVMLFEEWTTPGVEAKFLEEPGCSATQPYAREVTAQVTLSKSTVTVQYRGDFTAIRYDAAP